MKISNKQKVKNSRKNPQFSTMSKSTIFKNVQKKGTFSTIKSKTKNSNKKMKKNGKKLGKIKNPQKIQIFSKQKSKNIEQKTFVRKKNIKIYLRILFSHFFSKSIFYGWLNPFIFYCYSKF